MTNYKIKLEELFEKDMDKIQEYINQAKYQWVGSETDQHKVLKYLRSAYRQLAKNIEILKKIINT